jgi:hypothetical protein
MTARRAVCVLIALCWLMLAGCDSGNGVGATPGQTRLRVVNLIPNATFMTLTLDNDAPVVTGLGFQQTTGYIQVTGGTREFKVSVDGSASDIIDASGTIIIGSDNTYVVSGPVEAANAALLVDTQLFVPNGGTFDIRVLNVASGSRSVDLYLTPPGTDLTATGPAVAGVGVSSISAFVPVTTGSYEIRVTPSGTKEVIFDTGVITFGDKTLSEAVIYGTGSSKLVDVAVLNIDSEGTGQIYQNLLAEFKLLNASSVGSPLNVLVDGNLVLANVPFAGVSNYQITTAGSHNIAVQAAATPGADLLTIPTSLAPASDTSITVSGPAGALQALVLTDNNLPAAVGHARIRFVNASPDFPALDAYINFVKQFGDIASNSASPYTEIAADATGTTTYEFDFNLAGTTNRVVAVPGVVITSGKTYSVYVVGTGAAVQGVVVADD